MSTGLELTQQERRAGQLQAARTSRARKALLAQEAVPAILAGLLARMLTVVRLCDWCTENHFCPKPALPHRDCLNVRCECWCTTRRDQ